MSTQRTPERPPLSQIIIYAIGQLGWSLAIYGAGNLLVYFYLPPEESGQNVFPTFVYQGAILGVMTLVGLITFGGRFFDALTDPLIAGWSDRMSAKMGKRKFFLAIAAFPLAALSFLVFYPLSAEAGTFNTLWLIGTILLFYFFFTLYMVPYTALVSELGHHPKDRMKISTAIAVTWAIGFLVGGNIYAIQSMLESRGFSSVAAFQTGMAGIATIALIAMLVPVFFLQENRYAKQSESQENVWDSLRKVWSFLPFRNFVMADMLYWIAITFIQIGISYYIIVLMGMDKSYATTFMVLAGISSFVCYVAVNYLVGRFGKRPVLIAAFLTLASIFGLTALAPYFSGSVLFYFLALVSGFPMAAFSIVPNALIADMIAVYQTQSGASPAAMFFGVRNFGMKFGMSLANLIFPSLLLLGKSVDNPLGVQIAAGLALLFCVAGFLIFRTVKIQEG